SCETALPLLPPTSCVPTPLSVRPPETLTPGSSTPRFCTSRPVGTASMTAWSSTCCRVVLCTSTIGVSPVTVSVSSTAPTLRSTLTVAVNAPLNSTPSRLTVLKPGSANVTVYVPGRRSTILYWPVPSVTTERVCSISAGLDASTVTPGRTAPDA